MIIILILNFYINFSLYRCRFILYYVFLMFLLVCGIGITHDYASYHD